jgi:glycosyltransferase A (GT-A) superfamily protein (DUF2064 family)
MRAMIRPELMLFACAPTPVALPAWLNHYPAATAAAIQSCLIRASADFAAGSWPDTVSLYGWPDADDALFRELSATYGFALHAQAPGDLGARLHAALRAGIARCGAAAVLMAQTPPLDWDLLDDANLWLARGRHVLGLTERGGIYFLGLAQLPAGLFDGIDWAAPRPGEQFVQRAAALGMEFEPLPRRRALEAPEDLWLLAQRLPGLRQHLTA